MFATAALLGLIAIVLANGIPKIDPTANALRPRGSPAYAALAQVQARLAHDREPLWLIVGGKTVPEVALRLEQVQKGSGPDEHESHHCRLGAAHTAMAES